MHVNAVNVALWKRNRKFSFVTMLSPCFKSCLKYLVWWCFFTSFNRCVPLKRSVSTAPAWSHHWASTCCFTVRQTVFVWRRGVTCLVTFCIVVIFSILYVGVVHCHFCIMRSQNGCNVALFDVVCLCTCICECKAWKHSYICCHHGV